MRDRSQAKLDSFEEDLGLVGNDFNIAVSILNVGSVTGSHWIEARSDLSQIHPRPDSKQHDPYSREAFIVHPALGMRLVDHFRRNSWCTELRRLGSC